MKFWAGDFYGSIACLSKLCFMSMWPAFLWVPIPLSSPCRKVWPWNSLVAEGLTVSWSALDCKMMLSSVGIWLMNCRHATMATFVTGTQYVYHLIRLEPGAWLEMIFQARGNRPGLRCMELVLSPWHLRFPNGEHLWRGLIIPTLISWGVLSESKVEMLPGSTTDGWFLLEGTADLLKCRKMYWNWNRWGSVMSRCSQDKRPAAYLQAESEVSRDLCFPPSRRAPRRNAPCPLPCKGHLLGRTVAKPQVCTGARKTGRNNV